MGNAPKTGVGRTVDAFNFIRRVAFPSTRIVLLIFAALALFSTLVSLLIAGETLAQILVFAGSVFFWPAAVGEVVNSNVLLRNDKVLDFRRLMGLEFIAGILMGGFLFVFSIIGLLTTARGLWADGFLIGLAASWPFRFLTPMAMSSASTWRKLAAGLPTVILTTTALLIFAPFLSVTSNLPIFKTVLIVSASALVSGAGVYVIIRKVEAEGTREIHHSPMGLFRSFLVHWLRKTPDALEERLLSLSTEGTIETKILSFAGKDSWPKAAIVVSNFHPGPYRDMGSGGLPSELKEYLEQSQPAIVQVPHGISSHKLNIVSHQDIKRLLSAATANYPSNHPIRTASPVVREREGEAIVSGQAFGKVALLTITLAPEEMEDIPTEVAVQLGEEASRNGLDVLIVDAHNSLVGQTSITSDQAGRMITAGIRVLHSLASLSQQSFKVGASFDPLQGFTLTDGIGPGGMSVLVVKTGQEAFSYVTIDGNNMKQGLRDQILRSIRESGVTDGEIMTTDTHLVTGLVRSPLGYYPVGAALPIEAFIRKITETVRTATAKVEDSSAGESIFSLDLRVLGSDAFNSINGFIGRIARQIGRLFLWLEISCFVVSLVILLAA